MIEKHFKLTAETKVLLGVTFHRIQATKDLPIHGVKSGDLGGWVQKESLVSGNAWVFGDAHVYGNARVSGDAWVSGNAWVDSASAILCLTFAAFYTVTITRKYIFIGCNKYTREEIRKVSKNEAVSKGLKEEHYKPFRQMVLWGMRTVKEESEKIAKKCPELLKRERV